jgi:hypothetical protein
MISALTNYMPLNSAYLCQDCDSVGNSSIQCPACASQALMGLSSVFDRRHEERIHLIHLMLPARAA